MHFVWILILPSSSYLSPFLETISLTITRKLNEESVIKRAISKMFG